MTHHHHNSFDRAATTAVTVVLLLLAVNVAAVDYEVAVTGSSFFWQTVTTTTITPSIDWKAAFEADMQSAVTTAGSTATVAVTALQVNATAMFVSYTITPNAQAEAAQQHVFASELPTVNARVTAAKSALPSLADFFPTEVVFTLDVLLPRPSGVPEPEPVIVSTVASRHFVFITGDDDSWTSVVSTATSEEALRDALSAAAAMAVYRPLVLCDATITSLYVEASGDVESIGSGESGLLVSMTVTQRLQTGAHGAYGVDEVNSMLLTMDLTAATALYTAAGGPASPAPMVLATASMEASNLKCNGLCKGMIAMGAIAGAIIIFFIVAMIVYACCCPGGKGSSDSDQKEEEENSPPMQPLATEPLNEEHP